MAAFPLLQRSGIVATETEWPATLTTSGALQDKSVTPPPPQVYNGLSQGPGLPSCASSGTFLSTPEFLSL